VYVIFKRGDFYKVNTMFKQLKKLNYKKKDETGQAAVEYMLIFAAVVVVIVLALNKQGFITVAVNKTLEVPIDLLADMADDFTYNHEGEY
jgi:Flp pilus assembly pilin Flp